MSMLKPPKPPRARCERCVRPASHCLCAHIPSLPHRTQVLVLQHPDEARHPLNTARLAVLGLQHADLWVGEHFPKLGDLIASVPQAWLLFPYTDQHTPDSMAIEEAQPSLLVVPDGTWRKARQLIRAHPILDTLPRMGLSAGLPSKYTIRKAPHPAALSTVEAIARALEKLEPGQSFEPLLQPFDVLVQQQIAAMGEEVYRKNYQIH